MPSFTPPASLPFSSLVLLFLSSLALSHATWFNTQASLSHIKVSPSSYPTACGLEKSDMKQYGARIASLSTKLFKSGHACGTCYEVQCRPNFTKFCKNGKGKKLSVKVTATNACQSTAPSGVTLKFCQTPHSYFNLSSSAFQQIAYLNRSVIPVQIRRINCPVRTGQGIAFKITGDSKNLDILVSNVKGAGDVKRLDVKGETGGWISTSRKYGQIWTCRSSKPLTNQKLSFRVRTIYGTRTIILNDVTPKKWKTSVTYFAAKNFIDNPSLPS